MPAPVEFWFDFSSPYGYLASTRIDALAAKHGRDVAWRPFLLGALFKLSDAKPLTELPPIKANYFKHDFDRAARYFAVPYKMPAQFPFAAIGAARLFYWLEGRDPAQAKRYARAVYHAAFGEGRDVSGATAAADIAVTLGENREAVMAALNDPAVKDKLRVMVDEAIRRGVFGSPFIFVDGEGFWGSDRLEQVDRWLTKPW